MGFIKFALVCALLVVSADPAFAQGATPAALPLERSTVLSVNATGASLAPPDMATVNLGVEAQGVSAGEAAGENAQRMTTLMQALRRAGIAERDIQTAHVNLQPRYERRSGQPNVIIGYTATNTVRARVRAITNVGRVIDAAGAAGANIVHGVHFSRQDLKPEMDNARRDAIAEAGRRAELYASALGQRVVRVISVTEQGAAAAQMMDEAIVVTGSRIAGAPITPIAPGELETRVNVSVSFELR